MWMSCFEVHSSFVFRKYMCWYLFVSYRWRHLYNCKEYGTLRLKKESLSGLLLISKQLPQTRSSCSRFFIEIFEQTLRTADKKPSPYFTYVQDSFVIFNHGKVELHKFRSHLNSHNHRKLGHWVYKMLSINNIEWFFFLILNRLYFSSFWKLSTFSSGLLKSLWFDINMIVILLDQKHFHQVTGNRVVWKIIIFRHFRVKKLNIGYC